MKINNFEIIAHRGIWTKVEEQNSPLSLRNALSKGFGIETDLRYFNNEIIISHDPITKNSIGTDFFIELLDYYVKINSNSCLAINIKCDGIVNTIHKKILERKIKNYFFFDMTIPDLISSHKLGCKNLFARHSSFEVSYLLHSMTSGVWVDFFDGIFNLDEELKCAFRNFKQFTFVSPELHGYNEQIVNTFWTALKFQIKELSENKRIMICTDFPSRANTFFNS